MKFQRDDLAVASGNRRLVLRAHGAMALGMGMAGMGFVPTVHGALDPIAGARSTLTPRSGGILSRTQGSEPPDFDTMANTTSAVISVVGPCCNGLVRFDEFDPDKIVPDLADSWEVSPDGLVYAFRLKQGVRFHDGKPFTSADVKFTFDTLRAPPAGYISIRANLLDAVQSIDAPDPFTVRFILHRKSPSLLANLAGGWMVVLPKHILEKGPMKQVIVGTGPFKFKEYKRGVSIELVKNPDYHVPGRPYLDGVRIYMIPDVGTAFGYFRTGQLDVLPTSIPAIAQQWEAAMGNRAYTIAGHTLSSIALHFNAQQKPWDDIRVRQAACLAINRQEALATLMKGEGVVGGWSIPGRWALPKEAVQKIPGYGPYTEANITQAKKLLADAGFPNGFKETLLVRRIDLFTPAAIFIKDQLMKVGIDVTLDLQETATYNQSRNSRRFKLDAGARSYLTNDPDAIYGDTVTCDGALNFAKLCDPRIDALYAQQSQELDFAKRLALTQELETRALNLYGSYILFFRNQYRLYQNNVHGWPQHPNEDNNMRLAECWKERA